MRSLQFTREEMAAIIALVRTMALSDGDLNKKEFAIMSRELERFGIEPDDFMELLWMSDNMDSTEMWIVIVSMNEKQKRYVTDYLKAMMEVEDDICDAKKELWDVYQSLVNFKL